jgi:four helix bundle protein
MFGINAQLALGAGKGNHLHIFGVDFLFRCNNLESERRHGIFDFRFWILDLQTGMNESEMKERTKTFALRILELADALPRTRSGNIIANQIVRSGSSVGANYRALCRAKSRADFIHKTSVVEEEADETAFWLELIIAAKLLSAARINDLLQEANELTAIAVATRKTASSRT